MPLILGANSLTDGYEVDNSLRFNSGSSDNLSRTPATTTNRKTSTLSFWIKKAKTIAENDELFSFGLFSSASTRLYFRDGGDLNKLALDNYNGSSFTLGFSTNALFRDYSAWYHIVVAIDTTQATDTNRLKLYINGEQVTSFASINYGSLNEDLSFNNTSSVNYIGRNHQPKYFDGYMSEVNFIDGQQLAPSDFGKFDSATGIWTPIAYTGTYGTNGFYLEFKDSSALGDDTSGNNNDFTVNNLTSIDQTTDTPTNNFATLNPLAKSSAITLSDGNLKADGSSGGTNGVNSTIGMTSGKWYAEFKITDRPSPGNGDVGIFANSSGNPESVGVDDGAKSCSIRFGAGDGAVRQNNATVVSTGISFANNNVINIAFDMDSGKVWFGKNGTYYNSGDPAAGTNATYSTNLNDDLYFFNISDSTTINTVGGIFNFGNPPFTISSGNSDANGYGNFEYAVPSGYFALCTKNLAEYG